MDDGLVTVDGYEDPFMALRYRNTPAVATQIGSSIMLTFSPNETLTARAYVTVQQTSIDDPKPDVG